MTMTLKEAFARSTSDHKAFIPFIMGGDPDLATTAELIVALAECGATAIEVGVPFSDPIADGPVIQAAAERALAQGVALEALLEACAQAAARVNVPLVLFSYANPILNFGVERLASRARECGLAGVLLTDVPLEHMTHFAPPLRASGVDVIQIAAPTSSDARLQEIAAAASGFIYAVSRCGVTGEQAEFAGEGPALVARLRHYTNLPVVLGFGISSREHFEQACAVADGAVIGSALVRFIAEHRERATLTQAVQSRVCEWTAMAGHARPS